MSALLFRILNSAFLLLLLAPCLAVAYSGAGAECGNQLLELAAINGTPKELEENIEKFIEEFVEYQQKNRSFSEKIFKKVRAPSSLASDNLVRKTFVNSWYGCKGGLLDRAVAAGNIENANYLLNIGADPNGRQTGWADFLRSVEVKPVTSTRVADESTIFMRCLNLTSDRKSVSAFFNRKRSDDELQKVFSVYSLLIARGADLNAKDERGYTALHNCNDPESIRFFIENGANPNIGSTTNRALSKNTTPLSLRVYQVVTSTGVYKDTYLPIAEFLARATIDKKVTEETERAICYNCSGVEKNTECTALSKMLDVSDKRIFQSKGYVTNENSRSWRCKALLDPNCSNPLCKGDGDWRKHYDLLNE